MDTIGRREVEDRQDEEAIFNALANNAGNVLPYILRIGRAVAYGIAAYLLLALQPHYDFSFLALASAVFFLSITKRTLPVTEAIILLIAVSVFIPVGFSQTLATIW